MANNVVTYTINMGGNAQQSVTRLDNAVKGLGGRMAGLASRFAMLGRVGLGLSGVVNVLEKIGSKFREYTEANQAQQQAEAKLAQVMRNTMGANIAQIQSINDLAAAQQRLGVIGDEVQLAGAQELATYLGKTESLQKLIPVMNDMLAQQYGLNASQEQATQIASMMGKVMDGQVGALSRYGYKFDEAQEKILKYGTETEKVATLAEVIGQSVGGMNEALANTPEGKMKQLANDFGDLKERIGGIVVRLEAKLAPAMQAMLNIANHLIDGAQQLFSLVEGHLPALLGAAGFLGVALAVRHIRKELQKTSLAALLTGGSFTTMGALAKAACRKISLAITSIPIVGWIAAGIGIVIEVVQQLWNRCEGFRALVMGVWEVLKAVGLKLWEWIKAYYSFVWDTIKTVVGAIVEAVNTVWARVMAIVNKVKAVFSKVGAWFKRVMQPVWDWFSDLWGHVKDIIDRILEWLGKVFDPIIQLWNTLTGKVVNTYSQGAQKGRDSFARDREKKTTQEALTNMANGLTDDPKKNVVTETKNSATATATGGTRSTTVNINLGKMVESIVFNGGYEENEQDMEQRLAAMLSRILGMAEATAG